MSRALVRDDDYRKHFGRSRHVASGLRDIVPSAPNVIGRIWHEEAPSVCIWCCEHPVDEGSLYCSLQCEIQAGEC